MLLSLKFLEGLGESRFEVGGDMGLNIINIFFKIFAKCFHYVEVHGVNDGGEFRYHIIFRYDWQ